MSVPGSRSGSARVSRVGDGVAPSRTFIEAQLGNGAHYHRRRLPHFEKPWAIYAVTIGTHKGRRLSPKARSIVLNSDEWRNESSFRRDVETSTRDACATQTFQS
jgi:hypothetical protein